GSDVPSQVDSVIPLQAAVEPPVPPPPVVQATPQPPAPTAAPIQKSPAPVATKPATVSFPNRLWWIGGISAGALIVILAMVALFGRSREEERTCPTCGKPLQPYQTVCLECSVSQTRQSAIPDAEPERPMVGETVIITPAEQEEEAKEDESMIP